MVGLRSSHLPAPGPCCCSPPSPTSQSAEAEPHLRVACPQLVQPAPQKEATQKLDETPSTRSITIGVAMGSEGIEKMDTLEYGGRSHGLGSFHGGAVGPLIKALPAMAGAARGAAL